MATGSGKTLMMASLILTLYLQGYRNFLFFVNSTNILYKTIDNFCNASSPKYLFNPQIILNNQPVNIQQVSNFANTNPDSINICFTSIQKLQKTIQNPQENSFNVDDFIHQKVVLIGDEAHHNQSNTKNKDKKNHQKSLFSSWEDVIEELTNQNPDNLLLEFTATLDFDDQNIIKKYHNRVIYTYELRQFNQDKYSKNINLLQVGEEEEPENLPKKTHKKLILISLLINLYREHLARDNDIYPFKPVILFKAQKEIKESQANHENFIEIINNLQIQDLQEIFEINPTKYLTDFFTQNKNMQTHIFTKAVNYFKNYDLTNLVDIFKSTFHEKNIINVNNDGDKNKEKENQSKEEIKTNQKINLLINTLEDATNPIRVIFAVNKLNEGWDVLNLYDIVRLYNTRDKGKNKTGKTTMAEAQLIGRGARYYPFTIPHLYKDNNDNKYQRKFDNDVSNDSTNNNLQILENMYYYSPKNVSYISELKQALQELGIQESSKIQKEIKIKDNLINNTKFTLQNIYLNKQEDFTQQDFLNNIQSIDEIPEIYDFTYTFSKTEISNSINILANNPQTEDIYEEKEKSKHYYLNNIEDNILKSALLYLQDTKFLHSQSFQAIKKQNITIKLQGDIPHKLTPQQKFNIAYSYFKALEKHTKNDTNKKGTNHFHRHVLLNTIQKSKVINIKKDYENNFNQISQTVSKDDFFIYTALQTDSELEIDFYQAIQTFYSTNQQKINNMYLIRNMQELAFYTFKNGKKFYPDFIMLLENNKNEQFQILLESKGEHLVLVEAEKQDFLAKLDKTAKPARQEKIKILGLKFFTQNNHKFFDNLSKKIF